MYIFHWSDDSVAHLAEHGISYEDFEYVVNLAREIDTSDSSGYPIAFGYTEDRRYIACVFEMIDDFEIFPITAYETEEPA